MSDRRVPDWVDERQQHGRYTFTKEEVITELNVGEKAAEKALRRLLEKNRLARPWRTFYVVVPLEYRSVGAPPPSWYVDDLMVFLERSYYVGVLTAAGLHGAAHQRAQEFQIVADEPASTRTVGRSRLRFCTKKNTRESAIEERQTETGSMYVSTPEQTAVDLLRYVHGAGHLENVTTVLSELGGSLRGKELVEVAEHEELSNLQRLGFLLESLGYEEIGGHLHEWIERREPSRVTLKKGGARDSSTLNGRWNLYVNSEISLTG